MTIRNNLIGKIFGKLTVFELAESKIGKSGKKRTQWLCKCECGNEKVVLADALKAGSTLSCGCIRNPNLIGRQFGLLTVKEYVGKIKKSIHNRTYYLCICECGKDKEVLQSYLLSGITTSCGCEGKENLTGLKFNNLIVLREAPKKKSTNNRCWYCLCDCGNETIVPGNSLKGGTTKSCGCKKHERKINEGDYIGNVYGKLTVIKRMEDNEKWLCKCECGKQTTATLGQLKRGKKKSCGCLRNPDLTGLKVGQLTVIRRADKPILTNGGRVLTGWECRCECGDCSP